MKQITQKLGSGKMTIEELPSPILDKGVVIVENTYSLISPGTESSTIKDARMNLIDKAKSRPEDVKKVLSSLKNDGILSTFRAVSKRLNAYSPLGYSCVGRVIDKSEDVTDFNIGDFVAGAGAGYANHAEIVAIPKNLCVKLPENKISKESAFNTLGSIALQGVRKANLGIGEKCVVIGMGLIGQLTAQILKSSAVDVIGVDIDKSVVDLSNENNVAYKTFLRDDENIINEINNFTDNHGVDSVIITASTKNLDPINFAGQISRKHAKIIIVGDVPTGFNRNPDWYKKELQLLMSCSYGEGRYDYNYEEKGMLYPYHLARWTESRNMQTFQNLINDKKINLGYLITNEVKIDNIKNAYDEILENKTSLGILIKYENSVKKEKFITNKNSEKNDINLSVVGAGNYLQSHILPHLPKKNISRVGVISKTGTSSKMTAEKFGFQFCTSDINDIYKNSNTIIIGTRHNTHAKYVLDGIIANKNILVEKPLCLNVKELNDIKDKLESYKASLAVGYNRRFSSHSISLKNEIANRPISMLYRVNAGKIPEDSWINDSEVGGGRIIGELCHFIDYAIYLTGSLPIQVSAIESNSKNTDNLNVQIKFQNNSLVSISYFTDGNNKLAKEYIEVYFDEKVGIIDNFKKLNIYKNNKKSISINKNDKGRKNMVEAFVNNILNENNFMIPIDQLIYSTRTCFCIIDSIKNNGKMIALND